MRLATWNVLNGTSLSDGQVLLPRLVAAAGSLDADVLGLQEVDSGQPRSDGVDLVAEIGRGTGAAAWRFVPALVGTPGGQWRPATDDDDERTPAAYGVGLVSRHPVRSWHVLRLPAARVRSPILLPGPGRLPRAVLLGDEQRVVVAAVVDSPLGAMTVASTHLSFVPVWNLLQLRRVVRWLSRLPGPHVLVGDLNMPAVAAGLVSRWEVLARHRTFPAPEPRVQLDHLLGHGALPPVRRTETPVLPVSDHRALVVEL